MRISWRTQVAVCSRAGRFGKIFVNPFFHPSYCGVFGLLFGAKALQAVIVDSHTQGSLAGLKLGRRFPQTVVILGGKIYRVAAIRA
jgi:hypothetical protein